MSGIFKDPRMDMTFIKTWDSREEHCAKVAMTRSDELRSVTEKKKNAIQEMKELYAGAVMSKFISHEACLAFRDAVSKCISIIESQ